MLALLGCAGPWAHPPPANCSRALDAWCNNPANCPDSASEPHIALCDTNAAKDKDAWRCYALSGLNSNHTRYERGADYCTRDTQLKNQLAHCLDPSVPTPAPPPPPPAPTPLPPLPADRYIASIISHPNQSFDQYHSTVRLFSRPEKTA
jgi:hypothetical protein